jgi:hypothetical protein
VKHFVWWTAACATAAAVCLITPLGLNASGMINWYLGGMVAMLSQFSTKEDK